MRRDQPLVDGVLDPGFHAVWCEHDLDLSPQLPTEDRWAINEHDLSKRGVVAGSVEISKKECHRLFPERRRARDGQVGGRRCAELDEGRLDIYEDRAEQLMLAGEVMVQSAFGQAGTFNDLV